MRGKVAVVTGGSSGIGLATAERLAAEAASVFIVGRSRAKLDEAVAKIGGDATAVRGDVSREEDLDRLYAEIAATKNGVDIVFANAAVFGFAPLGRIASDLIDEVFGVNLKGVILTSRRPCRCWPTAERCHHAGGAVGRDRGGVPRSELAVRRRGRHRHHPAGEY